MKELFDPNSYDLSYDKSFKRRRILSVWKEIDSVFYLCQKIGDLVPN